MNDYVVAPQAERLRDHRKPNAELSHSEGALAASGTPTAASVFHGYVVKPGDVLYGLRLDIGDQNGEAPVAFRFATVNPFTGSFGFRRNDAEDWAFTGMDVTLPDDAHIWSASPWQHPAVDDGIAQARNDLAEAEELLALALELREAAARALWLAQNSPATAGGANQ